MAGVAGVLPWSLVLWGPAPPSGDAWLQEARCPRWLLLKPLPQVVSVAGLLRTVLPGKGSPPHWWHLY